jgi:hypothetical protein
VSVTARASASPTGASASASCSGARNCSASFESHSVADAYHDPKHYAHADADCSGGGSGGFCATSAVAKADAKSASAGASCSGSGAVCRHSYYAHGDADIETPTTKANGGVDCGDSGGFGGGGCGLVAYTEVDQHGVTRLHLGCKGPGCRFSGVADAKVGNLIAEGKAHQECSSVGEGSCSLGVKAELRPDRERENFKVDAFGSCVGTAGVNCKGDYSTRIALGTSTIGECTGVGSGGCHSRTETGKGNPVFSYGTCIEGLACDWKAKTHSDAGIKTADESLAARSGADCSTSSANGPAGCVTAAGIEVKSDNVIVAFASCNGGAGAACSYDARVEAKDNSGRNSADGWQGCGQQAAGSCGVSSYALTFTDRDKLHGEAIAGGTCAGTSGTACSGAFRTHVDSGRDTWSTCTGTGAGECHGVADPSNARSTGTGTGHIESKSPDEHKKGGFTADDTPVTIGANTHETFGRFLINQGRNVTDGFADIGTHFGNFGHLAWTGEEEPRRPGESEEEYTARVWPLKASWNEGVESVKQTVKDIGTHFGNFGHLAWTGVEKPYLPGESEDEYNARVWPLKAQWNQSMDMIGKIASGRAGHELFWDPAGTLATAASGPAMIATGGGAGALIAKLGTKSLGGGRDSSADPPHSLPENIRNQPGTVRTDDPGTLSPTLPSNAATPGSGQPTTPQIPGNGSDVPQAPTNLERAGNDPDMLARWERSHRTPGDLDAALDTIWSKVPDPEQRARLMDVVDRPGSLAKYLERVESPDDLERAIETTRTNGVPGGIDEDLWTDAAAKVRAGVESKELGGRLMVQGSRAVGVPGPDSDLDFAILMDQKLYDETLVKTYKTTHEQIAEMRAIPESEYKTVLPNAKLRGLWYAANKGKIARGELKLSALGKSLQQELGLGKDVDISAILQGGDLDQGPYLPVP